MRPYRILSLDGGGAWALIQVKCLKKLFGDVQGREVLQHFDLVAANSGGSIVAAGLAENKTLSELEDLFQTRAVRQSIFSSLQFREVPIFNRITRIFKIGPRYSAQRKYEALQEHMPEVASIPLHEVPRLIGGEHPTHFLIAGYDYYRNRAKFFRSNENSQAKTSAIGRRVMEDDGRRSSSPLTMVQAIHVSSNAPINYFDNPAEIMLGGEAKKEFYWDGAIGGYNNPVLSAVIEALCNGIKLEDVSVLSLGTGSVFLPLPGTYPAQHKWLFAPNNKPSLVSDLLKMTTSILGDPPDAATFVSYTMLFPDLPLQQERFIRLSPMVQPVIDDINGERQWVLPNGFTPEEFELLIELDLDAVQDSEIRLIEKLANQWLDDAVPNQPIRNDEYLRCLIGHPTFSSCKVDFENWGL